MISAQQNIAILRTMPLNINHN